MSKLPLNKYIPKPNKKREQMQIEKVFNPQGISTIEEILSEQELEAIKKLLNKKKD